jgi:virulence factor
VERLRTGVIGLGRMGQHHCRVYSNQREAQLVGVYDINPQVARETSGRYDVHDYLQLDDLLDQVDAVTIATPTPTHFDIAMKCLERKIHVLVEKPVTEKIEDAEHLARVIRDSVTIFQVGHIERFNPTYVELKKVLERLKVIAISFRRLSPYKVSNKDVDVVLDLMVHDLDLSNDLTGKDPVTITAYGLMPFSTSLDHVVAQLFYCNGPIITLAASRVTEQKIRAVEVTAEDAFVEADLMNKSISIYRGSTGEYSEKSRNGVSYHQESIIERILVPNVEPLGSEIKYFLECITQKRLPCVSIFDGLKALRLAQQICTLVNEQNLQFSGQPEVSSQKETN